MSKGYLDDAFVWVRFRLGFTSSPSFLLNKRVVKDGVWPYGGTIVRIPQRIVINVRDHYIIRIYVWYHVKSGLQQIWKNGKNQGNWNCITNFLTIVILNVKIFTHIYILVLEISHFYLKKTWKNQEILKFIFWQP